MSRARLVITAVVLEGRSQAEVARTYGLSPSWVSRLVAHYRAEGEAAFQPRSRRPATSPTATPTAVVELIVALREQLPGQGLDAGADTIAWHLATHHQATASASTIAREPDLLLRTPDLRGHLSPVGSRNVGAPRRTPGPSLARRRSCVKSLSSRCSD